MPGWDADARDHVTRLLLLLGDEPQRAELQETPDRVVESWKTLFAGYRPEWADLKATLNWFSERTPEMIVVRDISFLSTCEEHLLPFFGTVGVAYLPNDHALGESKLHQIVSIVSRKLQSQQRMTREIGEVVFDAERTRGVARPLPRHAPLLRRPRRRARGRDRRGDVAGRRLRDGPGNTLPLPQGDGRCWRDQREESRVSGFWCTAERQRTFSEMGPS